MADRTLTINHADGGSETYTINRDKFAGVRDMTVDGQTVSVDHTAVPKEQSKETTFGGSQSITVNRDIEPLLSKVVGGAAAAYSLRDLNDVLGNSNKVVRVRRSSDNAEKDFTASEMGAALEDWVGVSNDGFVETWYDQSGNGNDATQTVAASQPKIVDAGTYLGEIDFDGTDDYLFGGSVSFTHPFTSFSVSYTNVSSGAAGLWSVGPESSGFQAASFYRSDNGFALNAGVTLTSAPSTTYSTGVEYLKSSIFDTTSSEIFVNGSPAISGDAGSTNPSGGMNIGRFISTGGTDIDLNGSIKEIILYDSDQSANRAAIETNINNQYSIY